MEEKFIELMNELGLTKNEIDVYLDLLKNRVSTAYSVAIRINQHRSSVYDAITRLKERGFIVEIQEKNRKLYQTREYTAIEEYLKQKQDLLKEVTPYLKAISNTEMPEGAISVSYGLTRLRIAFSSIFNLNQEVLIWILPKNVNEILGDWFLKEIKETGSKKEIPIKIISPNYSDILKEIPKSSFLETRYLEEDTNLFTIVCSDTVFLIVMAQPITVIEIKNSDIAEGFKSRFSIFWERAEKTMKKQD